jgi:hypothetical protein
MGELGSGQERDASRESCYRELGRYRRVDVKDRHLTRGAGMRQPRREMEVRRKVLSAGRRGGTDPSRKNLRS